MLGAEGAASGLERLVAELLGLGIFAQRSIGVGEIGHGDQRVGMLRAQHAPLDFQRLAKELFACALFPSSPYSEANADMVLSVSGWSGPMMRR